MQAHSSATRERTRDTHGRLNSVSVDDDSAAYTYLSGSDRLQSTEFQYGGSPVLTTTRTWEYGERLHSIANSVNGSSVSAHQYLYDAVQRRTQATLADGSRWQYGYNDRDEVTSGKRTWSDWTPVAGQQFEYAFDNIGNRLSARNGGDGNGASLRSAAYTANALNQYTAITNAPYQPIIGAALATNCVTVNGSTNGVTRRCEYFHREITVTNGNGAVWTGVTVDSGGTNTNGGSAQPAAQQSLSYDEDGNLKSDGTWAYRWDGENRLVEMTTTNIASVPAAQRKKLQFVYDFTGRRVQKTVSAWNGSAFTNAPATKFVYDGWNVVTILDSQSSILQSFLWGQDLSGTMQGAGGIGGLLAIGDQQSGLTSFAAYDGNGNVTALVARDGSVTARYEYGPFGEAIRVTGVAASINPFRWSTKFTDEDSGLVYYGYRYYSPTLGRWLSRDPLGEEGGRNLYAALFNSPVDYIDADGNIPGGQKIMQVIAGFAAIFLSRETGAEVLGPALQTAARMKAESSAAAEAVARTLQGKGTGSGGPGGPPERWYRAGPGIAWAIALTALEASLRSVSAAANLALGIRSDADSAGYAIESAFINSARGDSAYAELDAIDAGLLMKGFAAEGALVAQDIFVEAGGGFDQGHGD